ncbi:VOC family protein [Actinoplanes palleronii]|uniref:Glyoxalase n=1 Tax=Actinoplanes palleronii TaxID=113570 RepID=A0ABQ4B0R3_9ACTN|nr:VOC family protein [Actinoplanes palleronii]GIE64274.1 glyoxalase [Actinoplanes palleronii]
MDFKLEIVVLPVTDVDRSQAFYRGLGWREDVDYTGPEGFRVVHFTPPGSAASIIIGSRVTDAAPGSDHGVHLVVDDIEAAHKELTERGAAPSEIFHDAGGVFHHAGAEARLAGPHPERQTYGSFLTFTDPDGNLFTLQEVTRRLPGRVDHVVYDSAAALEQALRDAATAHGVYEAETLHGVHDEAWPTWYATHMATAAGLAS